MKKFTRLIYYFLSDRLHRFLPWPDGRHVAQIDPSYEISMGNPTSGMLCIVGGPHLDQCNPSYLWSDDSCYLSVCQFFERFGVFRRQRALDRCPWKIDVFSRRARWRTTFNRSRFPGDSSSRSQIPSGRRVKCNSMCPVISRADSLGSVWLGRKHRRTCRVHRSRKRRGTVMWSVLRSRCG